MIVVVIAGDADEHHHVGRIADIQVQVGGAFLRVERRPVRDVHLGPEVRLDEEVRQARRQVEDARAVRVLLQRQTLHQVREAVRHRLGEVLGRRPVLKLQDHRLVVFVQQTVCAGKTIR